MNAWLLTGAGLNLCMLAMIVAWFIARRCNNTGLLEAARPILLISLAALYAWQGEGMIERRLALFFLVLIAGTFDFYRAFSIIRQLHPTELASYHILREKFPKRPWLMYFGYYQIQGIVTGLLAIPLAIICGNTSSTVSYWEICGLIVWVIVFVTRYLRNFNPSIPTAETRIPFPWLIWMAYCLMAIAAPGGIWGILSLIVICFLLR